jgi:hypothetical protein
MYGSEASMRLSPGISTPKSRGINSDRKLTLPLLVTRVLADHAHYVLSLYDAATFAKAFDRCSYFHGLK